MRDADVGDDGVADDGGDEHEEHYDAAQLEAVGDDGDDHGENGRDGVGDHGPELGFVGCVTELDDDGREEEAEGVEAGEDPEVGARAEPGGDIENAAGDF